MLRAREAALIAFRSGTLGDSPARMSQEQALMVRRCLRRHDCLVVLTRAAGVVGNAPEIDDGGGDRGTASERHSVCEGLQPPVGGELQ